MKKAIIKLSAILSIASLSVFTLASCSNGSNNTNESNNTNGSNNTELKDTYSNNLSKGEKVEEISFDVLTATNSYATIDIKSTDSFESVIKKLVSTTGYKRINKSNSVKSFYAKENFESKTTCKSKLLYSNTRNANTTVYDKNFYIGNYIDIFKETGEKDINESYLNRGVYEDINIDNLYIEYATNYVNKNVFQSWDKDFSKKNKAIYINERFENLGALVNDVSRKRICETNKDISFSIANMQMESYYQAFARHSIMSEEQPAEVILMVSEIEDVKFNLDGGFELTSNYLIIKEKFSLYSEKLYESIQEEAHNSIPYRYKDSYIDNEIWIDYKNINESFGYSYVKVDFKLYNIWDMYGSAGKYDVDEILTYEAYPINVSDEEISSKKQSFIDECKKNNILDIYTFS